MRHKWKRCRISRLIFQLFLVFLQICAENSGHINRSILNWCFFCSPLPPHCSELSKLNIFFVARAYTPFNSNRASHLFYDTLRFTCMFSCPLWCVAIFIYFSTSDVWTREKKISWALIFFLTCCTSFDEFCARFVLEFVWNFKLIGF